jgi:CubicO group peptidase (beta-lactamase class C family)
MARTDSLSEDEPVPDRAVGYMKRDGEWKPNTSTLPYRGTSAGGGYSTVEDLLRFANALTGHKLLNERDTATLTTGKVAMGPIAKYAYGFGDFNRDGVRWFGHNGGAPGMNGELQIFPESGYVIVVLANMDPPAAGQIMDFIAQRFRSSSRQAKISLTTVPETSVRRKSRPL